MFDTIYMGEPFAPNNKVEMRGVALRTCSVDFADTR
jgi:hypothetical protein